MILFHIDDSGNTGAKLDHDVEPIHWLVAVGIDESLVRDVDRGIYLTCCRHFGTSATSHMDFEVKGSELFSGRGCAQGMAPAGRIACYEELLSLLAPYHARIFSRGINKRGLAIRQARTGLAPGHPYDRGFQYLVERINDWLASPTVSALGLIVADEQQEVERRMIHQFNQWTHIGTTTGYRAREITHLLPSLHYVRSVDSRLVQMADCVAFLRNRVAKINGNPKTASDREVLRLWTTHCAPLVVDDRVWP
ncbi:DUF3800 domain-containing protein [Gemmatimonas sp.]|uniref:DUF3800 domain-containing protein n=1 Tax=Gemmatimonas sp. TaxID=1962908 RepID=UPI0022C71551|nr:DUF3800 domain-containing protein [Gemmatimonas sp.]MCZ8203109.1 DUF3800 domain-containing protein [Gemmatimonas sp.]